MFKLRPDQVIGSILELDLRRLKQRNKCALIFDLDNTLCRRGASTLDEAILHYLRTVQAAGFQVGILSNRRLNRNAPIVQDLGKAFPVFCRAGKPGRRGFARVLSALQANPETAVMIGDKWWTDILGAHRMRMVAIRVKSAPTFTRS